MSELEVFRAALERLLTKIDPGGFLSRELGVAWVDDGSGHARRLVVASHESENAELLAELREILAAGDHPESKLRRSYIAVARSLGEHVLAGDCWCEPVTQTPGDET